MQGVCKERFGRELGSEGIAFKFFYAIYHNRIFLRWKWEDPEFPSGRVWQGCLRSSRISGREWAAWYVFLVLVTYVPGGCCTSRPPVHVTEKKVCRRGAERQGGKAFPETLSLCPIHQMSARGHPLPQGMRRRNSAGHTAPCKQNCDPACGGRNWTGYWRGEYHCLPWEVMNVMNDSSRIWTGRLENNILWTCQWGWAISVPFIFPHSSFTFLKISSHP